MLRGRILSPEGQEGGSTGSERGLDYRWSEDATDGQGHRAQTVALSSVWAGAPDTGVCSLAMLWGGPGWGLTPGELQPCLLLTNLTPVMVHSAATRCLKWNKIFLNICLASTWLSRALLGDSEAIKDHLGLMPSACPLTWGGTHLVLPAPPTACV